MEEVRHRATILVRPGMPELEGLMAAAWRVGDGWHWLRRMLTALHQFECGALIRWRAWFLIKSIMSFATTSRGGIWACWPLVHAKKPKNMFYSSLKNCKEATWRSRSQHRGRRFLTDKKGVRKIPVEARWTLQWRRDSNISTTRRCLMKTGRRRIYHIRALLALSHALNPCLPVLRYCHDFLCPCIPPNADPHCRPSPLGHSHWTGGANQ